jgi:hypothetical protein
VQIAADQEPLLIIGSVLALDLALAREEKRKEEEKDEKERDDGDE